MSLLSSPRRSPRKRSRAQSISDTPENLPATASFSAKISQFANDSPTIKRPRTASTSSKLQPGRSGDGSAFAVTGTASGAATKAKSLQTAKKKAILHALDTPHPAPLRWRETYEAIAEMRREVLAPVDGMGCANAGDNEKNPKVRIHQLATSISRRSNL